MSSRGTLKLESVPGEYAICRLPPDVQAPAWVEGSRFSAITRTSEELCIVCEARLVSDRVTASCDWSCLRIAGSIEFSETGVIAGLSSTLARAGLSLFVVSTYDTDYLLVRTFELEAACAALRGAGHVVE